MKKEKNNDIILADKVTGNVGSGGFILAQTIFLVSYILYQTFAPSQIRFDPYPFILLNLLLSFQAAYTGPFVLWSQNRQAERDRQTARNTEQMVEQVKQMVEQQAIMVNQLKTMIEKVEEISEEILEDEEEILENEKKRS
jgi:uncharacterized membrane protein